jgi:hypothetical protein
MKAMLNGKAGLPPDELQNYLPDVWKRGLMAEQRAALICDRRNRRFDFVVARSRRWPRHPL